MKKLLIIFLFVSLICSLTAQTSPDTLWTKTFGGYNEDAAFSVNQSTDGGYIVAGYTCSFGAGSSDFWLVKIDENGNEGWNQTYGGNYGEVAHSVQQTSDEGYILAGFTYSFGAGEQDFWLVKTDENGNEVWNQTYGGNDFDNAYSVQQTSDGGYIIAGSTSSYGAGYSDFWLVKTDENGIEEWNQTYGTNESEGAQSVQQTFDGGFIVVGTTYQIQEGIINYWLVKTDENGNEQWNRTFGINDWDFPSSVMQTLDGGYIIAGSSSFLGGSIDDFWVVKTDENGIEEWNQSYGGNDNEWAFSVQQTIDEGFIIAGYIYHIDTYKSDAFLVKTNENGIEEWNKICGGDDNDSARHVKQTNDGGYIVAGWSESFGIGESDFWLVRLASNVGVDNNLVYYGENNISNYPNPFNPSTTIEFSIQKDSKVELTIYNLKGQRIRTLANNEFTKGDHSIIWNGDDEAGKAVSSGIYYYKLNVNGKTESVKKCLLLK